MKVAREMVKCARGFKTLSCLFYDVVYLILFTIDFSYSLLREQERIQEKCTYVQKY